MTSLVEILAFLLHQVRCKEQAELWSKKRPRYELKGAGLNKMLNPALKCYN